MLALIALLDWMYTRHEFTSKMRMSQREMKDELEQGEGDPRVRTRLRELRHELRKRSVALSNTRRADVIVTNPRRIAVALRYAHGEMEAPRLVAKGRGFMAAAKRRIAARHRIPVVQSPALARALYRQLGIDQQVQPQLYMQVARIIVWVFARRDAVREASDGAACGTHGGSPR